MRELEVFPLPPGTYRRSSGYGPRINPVTGKQQSLHRGVDYAAPTGTPLFAPFAGQVTTGYEAGGAGNWIWVVDGPNMFKSFHHSSYQVRSGYVNAGDVIAYIGTTGSSTGPHAHLELWDNGRNIDPTAFFDRAPLKGSAPPPAPAPEPTQEDEDIVKIIWSTQAAWAVSGLTKRHLDPNELAVLKLYGVKEETGQHDALLDTLTEIPRDKIAGTD